MDTVRVIGSTVRDFRFDRKYGTDTAGYEDPRVYAPGDPHSQGAHFYVPTRARPFLAFLEQTRVETAGRFVDFGCGKGRAMLLAATYGFKSVVGIEYSATQCAAAASNIGLFQRHVPDTDFEVLRSDAGDYEIQPWDRVFYFYDPFVDDVIVRCLENIRGSIEEHPRGVAVIYHNNFAARPNAFDQAGFLGEVPTRRFDGNAFFLYQSPLMADGPTVD